jgi:hypothetical protein
MSDIAWVALWTIPIIAIQIIDKWKAQKEHEALVERLMKSHYDDKMEWHQERQQLLDRIQAPSFDHLKHQEAKIIKAQNEQPKEVVTLEVV